MKMVHAKEAAPMIPIEAQILRRVVRKEAGACVVRKSRNLVLVRDDLLGQERPHRGTVRHGGRVEVQFFFSSPSAGGRP